MTFDIKFSIRCMTIAGALALGSIAIARPPATGPSKPAPATKPAPKKEDKITTKVYAMQPVFSGLGLKNGSSNRAVKNKREKIGAEVDTRTLEADLRAMAYDLVVQSSPKASETEIEVRETDIAVKGYSDVHAGMTQLLDAFRHPVIPGADRPAPAPAEKPKPAPGARPGGKPPATSPAAEGAEVKSNTTIVAYSISQLPVSASGLRIKTDTEIHEVLDALGNLVEKEVAPDSWVGNGGTEGELRLFGGVLVVRQTPANQKLIDAYLKSLSKTPANDTGD